MAEFDTVSISGLNQKQSPKSILQMCLNSIIKVVLRVFTNKSEIHRLLVKYETDPNPALLISKIVKSLSSSKNKSLREIAQFLHGRPLDLTIEKCSDKISGEKFHHSKNDILLKNLENILLHSSNYGFFKNTVLTKQIERFCSYDDNHEQALREIWENLSIEPLTGRISKQWSYLGFQGTDPATDFRGMGALALYSMHHMSKKPETKNLLMKSQHPKTGFPWAMICINITSLLIELVKGDFEKLCIKLYRKNPFCEEEEALEIFYDLFVDIVEDFLRFFTIEDQSDLLQFSKYRSDYKSILLNNGRPHFF